MTATAQHWLHELCNPRYLGSPKIRVMAQPWLVDIGGATWSAATDGRTAVFLLGAEADSVVQYDAEQETKLLGVLAKGQAGKAVEVSLPALKAWLSIVPGSGTCTTCKGALSLVCDECSGTGGLRCICSDCDNEHRRKCEDCAGLGHVRCDRCADGLIGLDPEIPEGLLYGVPMDRARLARVLARLDGETVTLRTPTVPESPVLIESPGQWIVLQMGLYAVVDIDFDEPGRRFPAEAPATSPASP